MSVANEARLNLLGWNFRVADVSVRERVAFTADEVREALAHLLSRGVISEGVIVSTCHRSEIYCLADEESTGERMTRFVSEWRGLDHGQLSGASFHRVGAEAARHLFRVAAGLDSMALGESEVLGQVRAALNLARESQATHAVLHRLFESAVAAGKRVRTETEISRHPLSIPAIGFSLAAKVFGEMSERAVLVIGAGETGSLFARRASEAGVRALTIVNRSLPRAEDLAARVGGRAVPWEALGRELESADLVVGTTSSPAPVVTGERVEAVMRLRRGRPMFFLDLAVPRDIAPEVSQVYNVFAHSINDLEEVARENRARRSREVPRAEAIVEEEVSRFLTWFGNLAVVPTLTQLKRLLDQVRDEALAGVPEGSRERLRVTLEAFSGSLLREWTKRLKEEPDAARKLERVEAVRHMFGLDRE